MIRKAIFIDGSHVFHLSQTANLKLDYRKLKNYLVGEDERLVYANFYTAVPPEHEMEERQRNFLDVLRTHVRLKVKTVPLYRLPVGVDAFRYSKGEDILLASDMIRGALLDHYDTAVLVSGDGDFMPAVSMVQEAGKQVVVVGFQGSISKGLNLEANHVIVIGEKNAGHFKLDSGSGHD